MANPKGYNMSVVRKVQPSSLNSVSVYGKVDIAKDGSFSVGTKSLSGATTVYSFPPPSKDYLSTRRLSHNRISAIGSSTVAIDNKIEQAMDLVKSHLMFAVREEVEVLKEQIAELIERNNQLEYENSILRAAASPETLAKLSQPRQPLPSSSSS